ncbi:hypothetical protein ACTHHL_06235 [Aeribacillus composti]|uniref:hypothetical protein n=1 Tax=Aeribacillus TaxID=1055323 RepID=UPI001199DBBF|nr:hypothetical protein [Aeribacillus composti]TVZ80559.1 hypothetical protein FB379_1196 [Aeribacillus composti]
MVQLYYTDQFSFSPIVALQQSLKEHEKKQSIVEKIYESNLGAQSEKDNIKDLKKEALARGSVLKTITLKRGKSNALIVPWKSTKFYAKARGRAGFGRFDRLGEKIDDLASEYVYLKNWIEENFFGEQRKERLDKLDQFFQQSIQQLADSFSKSVGGFFVKHGLPDVKEEMYNDILKAYEQRIGQYTSFLRKHENYAQIDRTDVEQLLRGSHTFKLEALRQQFLQKESALETGDQYTIYDFEAAGSFYQEAVRTEHGYTAAKSEEQIGIELGLLGMKLEALLHTPLSEKMRGNLEHVYQSFIQKTIESYNRFQEEKREEAYGRSKRAYSILDSKIIDDIISSMRRHVKEKNIDHVFLHIIPSAYVSYEQKTNDANWNDLVRYHSSKNDWDMFFQNDWSAHHAYYPFTYNNLINNWNSFINKTEGLLDMKFDQEAVIFEARI